GGGDAIAEAAGLKHAACYGQFESSSPRVVTAVFRVTIGSSSFAHDWACSPIIGPLFTGLPKMRIVSRSGVTMGAALPSGRAAAGSPSRSGSRRYGTRGR